MKELVITGNEAGQRFDKFLRKYLKNMPLSGIYKAIRKKDVVVNGKKSSEKYILNEGDIINFKIELGEAKKEKKLDFLNIEYDFDIAYEDDNLLVVEKRPGVLIHTDEGKDSITLTDEVKAYLYDKGQYNPEAEKTFSPSPCNRLDRNTEGLVIFAKNFDTLRGINEVIRNGTLNKYYVTLVKGRIKDGVYTAFMTKNPKTNRVKISRERVKDSKEIITEVRNIDSIGAFSLVEINLVTGRSHQIRAHLSWLKNPIVGDPKYGDSNINNFFKQKYGVENQMLVAYKLTFKECPDSIKYLEGKTITMQIPPKFKKIKNDLFKF